MVNQNTAKLANRDFTVLDVSPHADIHAVPLLLPLPDGSAMTIKLDALAHAAGYLIVAGWASRKVKLALESDNAVLPAMLLEEVNREDVRAALNLKKDFFPGFACVASCQEMIAPHLFVITGKTVFRIALEARYISDHLNDNVEAAFGERAYQSLCALLGIEQVSHADGALDYAFALRDGSANVCMLHGWLFLPQDSVLRVETESGEELSEPLVYFWPRPDIDKIHGVCRHPVQRGYGITACVRNLPKKCRSVALCAFDGIRNKTVCLAGLEETGYWSKFVRKVLDVPLPWAEASLIYDRIVFPWLNPMQIKYMEERANIRPEGGSIGAQPAMPAASVVIPLYGNLHFLHTQILCFSEDSEFMEKTELIYVLDDISLVESFVNQIEILHQIFHIPCRWVFRRGNSGFSAANNLGASVARGEYLVFMNSDAFPLKTGWLNALCSVLQRSPQAGLVGCRLLYPDGSLQHTGMEYVRQHASGVWSCVHRLTGCDPSLDDAAGPTPVAAVTGACVCLRREDFEAVDGWSTDYLIGDFEDSDLCFKIRALGKDVIYQPEAELAHLERQSFAGIGNPEFRHRLFLYNAVTHQNKWGPEIAAVAKKQEAFLS